MILALSQLLHWGLQNGLGPLLSHGFLSHPGRAAEEASSPLSGVTLLWQEALKVQCISLSFGKLGTITIKAWTGQAYHC